MKHRAVSAAAGGAGCLEALARGGGRDDIADAAAARLADLAEGLEALWSDALGTYTVRDLRAGGLGEG